MKRVTIVIITLTLVLAACGGKKGVGSGVKAGGSGGSGCVAINCGTTTTAKASTATTAPATATTAKAAPTTAKPAATTQPPQAPTLVIKIQGSTADGGAFNPGAGVTIPRGSLVRWQNTDSVPRSVVDDDNRFSSPMLAPGQTFDYKFPTPGQVKYHDGTRPFAVGSFNVS